MANGTNWSLLRSKYNYYTGLVKFLHHHRLVLDTESNQNRELTYGSPSLVHARKLTNLYINEVAYKSEGPVQYVTGGVISDYTISFQVTFKPVKRICPEDFQLKVSLNL